MVYSKVYKEVFDILSYMDKITVMKIPMDILKKLKNQKDDSYITRIDRNDLFNENNIDSETLDLLCFFYKKYWT